MRVLVACEFSGIVRDAFAARDHDAWSCDLLPTERPGQHIVGDVLAVLRVGWDLIIAHPPCTHLSCSGARWFAEKRADGRQQQGIDFFMAFTELEGVRVAIENPIGIMSTEHRKPDQIVQPYHFGDSASKATCLWLKGLPLLVPTNVVGRGRFHTTKGGKRMPEWYNLPPGPNRAKIRSQTFPGFADAMAEQWG